MPNYKRNYVPGGTYFFTAVTSGRRPILTTDLGRTCLRDAIDSQVKKRPFSLDAIVLLPDHLHTIWTLPEGDADYSVRWAAIKESFTRSYLKGGGQEGSESASRRKHRERSVWQRRFWEHTVRNEDDLIRCLNYIHWNPVKHGIVGQVREYEWSSFRRYVELGEYDLSWGTGEVTDVPGAEWE